MGFMEGFANSFGRQMEQGAAQRATAKRDAFQIAYDQYLKKQSDYDSSVKSDQQRIQSAKAIAASVPGLPEGAWEHAYQWLGADYTPGQVEEKLRTTQFASQEEPSMPDQAQATDPAAQPATAQETQMADSGLAPGQAETTAQQDPDIMGSIFGANGLLNPQAIQTRQMERANGDVMGAAGIDQAQFDQVQAGYKPAPLPGQAPAITGNITPAGPLDPNDAVWIEVGGKWQQGIVNGGKATDLLGNPVEATSVRTNEQFTQIRNVLASIPGGDKLPEKKANAITLVEDVATLSTMAAENPTVLTRAVALSVGLNEITNEVNSAISQLQALGFDNEETVAAEQQITDRLAQALMDEGTDAADAQTFAALAIGVKFSLAKAMNGDNGVLSEADRAAGEQALSTNDPAIFLKIANQLANKSLRDVDILTQQIGNSPQANEARTMAGVDLAPMLKSPKDDLSPNAQQWLTQSSAPTTGPGATGEPAVDTAPQGQVLETGTINADVIRKYGLSEDLIGKEYRLFENGIDVLE